MTMWKHAKVGDRTVSISFHFDRNLPDPPNLRTVHCCAVCAYGSGRVDHMTCIRYEAIVDATDICDDYEPADGEAAQ